MFRKFIAVVALCLIPVVASGNNLSSSFAPPNPTNSPGVSNWTGPYAGFTFGIGADDSTASDFDEDFAYGQYLTREGGVTGGLSLGYNYQVNSSGLIGVEADFSGSSFGVQQDDFDWESHYWASSAWFSTIRARAGLTVGPTLIFATAGIAFVEETLSLCEEIDCESDDSDIIDSSSVNAGLVVGVGLEYALSSSFLGGAVTTKVEYLYISPQTRNVAYSDASNDYERVTTRSDINLVRFGVNYHF